MIIENIFQVLQRNTRSPWNPFCFEKDLTKTDAKVFKATMAHILATAAKAISKIVSQSVKAQIADVLDRKSTRLNSSHGTLSRIPSSA